MTEDQRIDRVEDRIDRLESKIDAIDAKITAVAVALAKRVDCPAPGSCMDLKERVTRLENTHDTLTNTVADLIRWRAWLTGINLVISSVSLIALGIIGNYIAKHL